MENLDYRDLRQRGREALERAEYSPKKLILWHTGVTLLAGFVLSLLSYFLDREIGGTGGLSGLQLRATLETVRSILQIAESLLLPFWAMGLTGAMLGLVRGQYAGPESLLGGFRCWGAVLRANLLKAAVYFLVIFVASQIGTTLFSFSPAGKELYSLMEQIQNAADPSLLLTEELLADMGLKMLPFILVPAVLLLIPVTYYLRMMDYVLMDRPELGAVFALRLSLFLMRKRCIQLFKVDLRFWWFYVLEALTVVLCYGDMLLPLFGISMPGDAAVMSFVFYAIGILAQLGLYAWKKDEVSATYACVYEMLLPPPPQEEGIAASPLGSTS